MRPFLGLDGRRTAREQAGGRPTAAAVAALIFVITFSGAANSQSRLDPTQAEKTFDALQAEERRERRTAVRVPSPATPEIRADTRPFMKLSAVVVEGAAELPGDAIDETYRGFVGKTVSQADLAAIARNISDLYRERGFHLSRAIIPAQDIKGGKIRVRVIEGRIAEIVLKGEGAERFGIRPLLAAVTAEQPARLATLERKLLLVNNLPGVRIADTALEEIGVATGNFRLILELETWRLYTALGAGSWGTPAVGPIQSYLAANVNSQMIPGDTFGANFATVPGAIQELAFGRLFYDAPVGNDGARAGATVSYSEIRPGDETEALDTRTRVETFELWGKVVPLQSRKSSLSLLAAVGLSNATESDADGTNYRDRLRTVRLAADYQLRDDAGGSNFFTFGLRQGIDAFDASHAGDTLLSRADGSGKFSIFDFSFTRYQRLTETWSLKLSAAGQWASRPLLASQEFYLGGTAFGRGYYSSELSGDSGIAGSVELRFDQKLNHQFFKGYQLYGFIDGGVVRDFRPASDDTHSLSSFGAGVRLFMAEDFQAVLEVSAPLSYRGPSAARRDAHLFFSVTKAFRWCPDRVLMRCS
jgi:hemolysin activation/secretion protein